MTEEKNKLILSKYIPEEAVEICNEWIKNYRFHLKITKRRRSKFGDYAHPHNGKGHRITVNHDLNQYSFLITLVHEVAHLTAWNKFKNKTAPHGTEWKREFKSHLQPLFDLKIFPREIEQAVKVYISNPSASSCSDLNLMRALKKHDKKNDFLHLEDLPEKSIFILQDGRKFLKGQKLRKRYQCIELRSRAIYLISPVAEVIKENTLF